MTTDADLFALFLALGESRLAEARASLGISSEEATTGRSMFPAPEAEDVGRAAAALLPLAVDAALLGAEGVSTLAAAIAEHAHRARHQDLVDAMAKLSSAVDALGHADASGARTDERALIDAATRVRGAASREPEKQASIATSPTTTTTTSDEVHWVPSLPEELVSAFLDECQERIEALSGRILRIEQEGPGVDGGEEVRALFRDLHTLKGSSGFAGLVRLNRLAHAAEDLVGKVRDGKAPCDRPVVDVLLSSIDRFRAIVERAAARAEIDVEVDDLIERLHRPSAYVPENKPIAAPTAATPVAAASNTLRVEFERIDALQNFVNELVLARGRLTRASARLSVGGELGKIRRQLGELGGERTRDRAKLDRELSLLADDVGRAERVADEGNDELEASIGTLASALGQLRDRVMKLRMVPIARLFGKHQRTVRELGQQLEKKLTLELIGQDTELDKVLVEQLEDPLIHLVRNAVDHGIERPAVRAAAGKPEVGTLTLRARQQGGAIVIEISDDGAGIDVARVKQKAIEKGLITELEAAALDEREAFALIFRAGFSTADRVTDVSGRGVGMDVVRDSIARLKGTIEIRSELGRGATFELRLPLTLAIAHVLLARVGGEEVAIPIDAVAHTLALGVESSEGAPDGGGSIEELGGRACYVQRDPDGGARHVPVIDLAETLGLEADHDRDGGHAHDVGGSGRAKGHLVLLDAPLSDVPSVALSCDALLGRHEVVVKPLGPLLSHASCVAGASLMGDRVVLLLDVAAVVRRGLSSSNGKKPAAKGARVIAQTAKIKRARVLVAEDADVVREALRHALHGAGLDVTTARDGREALELAAAQTFDLVSTDVMMPRMDGYELTRALRAMPAYAKVPIVMVTSRDQRVDVLRGYDAGVDAYVTKPADVHALLREIETLLGRRK